MYCLLTQFFSSSIVKWMKTKASISSSQTIVCMTEVLKVIKSLPNSPIYKVIISKSSKYFKCMFF